MYLMARLGGAALRLTHKPLRSNDSLCQSRAKWQAAVPRAWKCSATIQLLRW